MLSSLVLSKHLLTIDYNFVVSFVVSLVTHSDFHTDFHSLCHHLIVSRTRVTW